MPQMMPLFWIFLLLISTFFTSCYMASLFYYDQPDVDVNNNIVIRCPIHMYKKIKTKWY